MKSKVQLRWVKIKKKNDVCQITWFRLENKIQNTSLPIGEGRSDSQILARNEF